MENNQLPEEIENQADDAIVENEEEVEVEVAPEPPVTPDLGPFLPQDFITPDRPIPQRTSPPPIIMANGREYDPGERVGVPLELFNLHMQARRQQQAPEGQEARILARRRYGDCRNSASHIVCRRDNDDNDENEGNNNSKRRRLVP